MYITILYICTYKLILLIHKIMITTKQFQTLDDLYDFYNQALFAGQLPECIVNLSRRPNSYGFFVPKLWANLDDGAAHPAAYAHEISLNPDYLQRPFIEWHSTFVHEMVHLWQQEYGKTSSAAYHNKQWANKMESIGLMPSNTGEPGGTRTGQSMSHYVIAGGRFELVFNSLAPEDLDYLRLKYLPTASLAPTRKKEDDDEQDGGDGSDGDGNGSGKSKKSRSGIRVKYSCACGFNIWARSGLSVKCCACDALFVEE